jgi:hypothetical protein
VGSANDVAAKTEAGFAPMGGGKDLDEAFRWMCERAGGGDFLVLRATGDDDYNPYIAGDPLTGLAVAVQKVLPGRKFNLKSWTGDAIPYELSIQGRKVVSSQPSGSLY